jgi:hypothetical protein
VVGRGVVSRLQHLTRVQLSSTCETADPGAEVLMWRAVAGPWPWYVGGPLVGLFVPLLLLLGNKQPGLSGSLRAICAAVAPGRVESFRYEWKAFGLWSIALAFGIARGSRAHRGDVRGYRRRHCPMYRYASWTNANTERSSDHETRGKIRKPPRGRPEPSRSHQLPLRAAVWANSMGQAKLRPEPGVT